MNDNKNKPRLIKDFNKLDEVLQEIIRLHYPNGFRKHLVTFKNHKNELINALPFETEDYVYMLKIAQTNELPTNLADADNDEEQADLMQEILETSKQIKEPSSEEE